jgi:hypothetical protein
MLNGKIAPPPRSQSERELERTQRTVTAGLMADERRKSLILELHRGGMSQVEITARLDRASRSAGGEGVTEDSVNKIVARSRRKVRT